LDGKSSTSEGHLIGPSHPIHCTGYMSKKSRAVRLKYGISSCMNHVFSLVVSFSPCPSLSVLHGLMDEGSIISSSSQSVLFSFQPVSSCLHIFQYLAKPSCGSFNRFFPLNFISNSLFWILFCSLFYMATPL
jgi:hypothetical protein